MKSTLTNRNDNNSYKSKLANLLKILAIFFFTPLVKIFQNERVANKDEENSI